MPVVVIRRREYSLRDPAESYRFAARTEYSFDPPPAGWLTARAYRSDSDNLHQWYPLAPAEVRAPPGSRLVGRPTPRGPETRLAYHADPVGLPAGAIYGLARRGQEGFSMAKRRRDDGPTLFGERATPAVGAYGPASRVPSTLPDRARADGEGDRPYPVSGAAIDDAGRLRDGIARALDQLRRAIEEGDDARVVTARAILEGLLGGGTEAA